MVDWNKLGKKALDLGKQATDKGVDSFQSWKNDPERLEKVAEKKRNVAIEKEQSKQFSKDRKKRKKDKKQIAITVLSDSRGKVKLKDSARIIVQEYDGEVYFSDGTDKKINYYLESFDWSNIQQSKKTTSIGGALVGNAIAGGVGAIIGGTGKKSSVDKSTAVLTLENVQNGSKHRLVINCPQTIANQLQSFTTKDFI